MARSLKDKSGLQFRTKYIILIFDPIRAKEGHVGTEHSEADIYLPSVPTNLNTGYYLSFQRMPSATRPYEQFVLYPS